MSAQPIIRFEEPPGPDFVSAFREHVRQTARPETFPGVTQTGFPRDGRVEVLFRPISVNDKARGGSRVPCPICSTAAGKWLSNGTLIWCEDTEAVYVIGPDCYTSLDGGDRISSAINAYNVEEQERRRARILADIATLAPDLISWATASKAAATAASKAQAGLRQALPRLRSTIHRVLKANDSVTATFYADGQYRTETIGKIAGRDFLIGQWDLATKLTAAIGTLQALARDASPDARVWADGLSPTARKARLGQARAAVTDLEKVSSSLLAASQFLAADNIRRLAIWSVKGPPTEFSVNHTASKVVLTVDGKSWEGPVGIKPPVSLPEGLRAMLS
ncbi:hypothetical protein E4M02_02520 [Brevundimonas sp. S30B]|nr:hypothetical protein E4M02_02520 [Brevundimonas sp. S30B]